MNTCWGIVYWYPVIQTGCVQKEKVELGNLMRHLLEERVAWTGAAVSSLGFNTPDASLVVARLLKNTSDMGDALHPYYGDTVAQMYGQLLSEHITLAGDLVKAMGEGNAEKAWEIEKQWFATGMRLPYFEATLILIYRRRILGGCSIGILNLLNKRWLEC